MSIRTTYNFKYNVTAEEQQQLVVNFFSIYHAYFLDNHVKFSLGYETTILTLYTLNTMHVMNGISYYNKDTEYFMLMAPMNHHVGITEDNQLIAPRRREIEYLPFESVNSLFANVLKEITNVLQEQRTYTLTKRK